MFIIRLAAEALALTDGNRTCTSQSIEFKPSLSEMEVDVDMDNESNLSSVLHSHRRFHNCAHHASLSTDPIAKETLDPIRSFNGSHEPVIVNQGSTTKSILFSLLSGNENINTACLRSQLYAIVSKQPVMLRNFNSNSCSIERRKPLSSVEQSSLIRNPFQIDEKKSTYVDHWTGKSIHKLKVFNQHRRCSRRGKLYKRDHTWKLGHSRSEQTSSYHNIPLRVTRNKVNRSGSGNLDSSINQDREQPLDLSARGHPDRDLFNIRCTDNLTQTHSNGFHHTHLHRRILPWQINGQSIRDTRTIPSSFESPQNQMKLPSIRSFKTNGTSNSPKRSEGFTRPPSNSSVCMRNNFYPNFQIGLSRVLSNRCKFPLPPIPAMPHQGPSERITINPTTCNIFQGNNSRSIELIHRSINRLSQSETEGILQSPVNKVSLHATNGSRDQPIWNKLLDDSGFPRITTNVRNFPQFKYACERRVNELDRGSCEFSSSDHQTSQSESESFTPSPTCRPSTSDSSSELPLKLSSRILSAFLTRLSQASPQVPLIKVSERFNPVDVNQHNTLDELSSNPKLKYLKSNIYLWIDHVIRVIRYPEDSLLLVLNQLLTNPSASTYDSIIKQSFIRYLCTSVCRFMQLSNSARLNGLVRHWHHMLICTVEEKHSVRMLDQLRLMTKWFIKKREKDSNTGRLVDLKTRTMQLQEMANDLEILSENMDYLPLDTTAHLIFITSILSNDDLEDCLKQMEEPLLSYLCSRNAGFHKQTTLDNFTVVLRRTFQTVLNLNQEPLGLVISDCLNEPFEAILERNMLK